MLQSYPRLTVEEGRVAFFSHTLELLEQHAVLIRPIRPQLYYFAATFTRAFTRTLAKTRLDVLFIVHAGDYAFTTARGGHSHRLCSHSCDQGQETVKGSRAFLVSVAAVKLHALPPPSAIKNDIIIRS